MGALPVKIPCALLVGTDAPAVCFSKIWEHMCLIASVFLFNYCNVEEVKEKLASFDKKDAGNVEKEPAKEESASFDKKDAVAQKDPADEKKPTQDQRVVLKPPLKEFGPSEAQKDKEKQGKGNKRHVARELSWQRKVARERSPTEDSHFSQSSSSSSSSSYSTSTQTERMRLPEWIAVDWHNTLELRGG